MRQVFSLAVILEKARAAVRLKPIVREPNLARKNDIARSIVGTLISDRVILAPFSEIFQNIFSRFFFCIGSNAISLFTDGFNAIELSFSCCFHSKRLHNVLSSRLPFFRIPTLMQDSNKGDRIGRIDEIY